MAALAEGIATAQGHGKALKPNSVSRAGADHNV